MKKITDLIRRVASLLGQNAVDYYEREPVKVHNAIVAAILAGATALGLTVLNPAIVLIAVTFVVPVVVQAIREQVFAPKTVAVTALEALAADPESADAHGVLTASDEHHPGDLSGEPEVEAAIVEDDPDATRT